MPANLTPAYLAAEARFRAAKTTQEKLAALDEMYATIPKHKGTEKLRAGIKRRISKLREQEKQPGKPVRTTGESTVVGQIIFLGPPSSGKSSLLGYLTGADPAVTDYQLAMGMPLSGAMEYQDVSIQLLDAPAASEEDLGDDTASLARSADAVAVVLDLAEDSLLDQFEDLRAALSYAEIVIVGQHTAEHDYPAGIAARPALVVAAKLDLPNARENLDALQDLCGDEFEIQPVSIKTGDGLEDLRFRLFELLGIIRIYAKSPGEQPDMSRPHILKKESTLVDFAAITHRDLSRNIQSARAWRKNDFEALQIDCDYVLEDGDVIELRL